MDELIGQLIWAFVSASDDLDDAEEAARAGRIGGVWLLPTEMRGPAETAVLVNRLQAAAPCPLLIGVDAEAGLGLVMRGATQLPTAMALGAAGDPALVRLAAAVTASEAGSCGINAVAAPVLDVNINADNPIINTRAFGEDPDLVAQLGVAFMEGLASHTESPVLPIGKHFPGHGDTVADSHLQLEVLDQPRSRLERVELPPFRAAIAANIPMLMTAHVAYPALDPAAGLPATLSRPILTDLLRDELGFDGAVVTDCMNMFPIAHNFDARDATVRALLAGCDLILTHQWDLAYEAILHAMLDGRVTQSRIHEAAARVRSVKARIFGPELAAPRRIEPYEAEARVGTPAHAAAADRIARASVTVVDGVLPPPGRRPLIMATRMARRYGPSVEAQIHAALDTGNGRVHEAGGTDVLMLNPIPDAAQERQAVELARAAGSAILLHFNRVQSFDPDAVLTSAELVSLADSIAAAGVPLTVVSMGSPYILPQFRSATARLCSYSTCDASVRATVDVLLGTETPLGRLPVSAA